MKLKRITIYMNFFILLFLLSNMSTTNALQQDDSEGHTFDFSPYSYYMQTEFYNTYIPVGQSYAYPTLKLYSSFMVDQAFQDYFSKWWRWNNRYVHEIEERIISGSNQHYFDYRGFYYTNIQDTFVDYEVEDDSEWELHVRDPEDNLLPGHYYYVWSLWDSINGLGVGTYSNSHWLTSEVDGFNFNGLDYDHLLRQTYSFTIYQGGGGGTSTLSSYDDNNEQPITEKYEDLPLSVHPSEKIITIKCPLFNFKIEIRQIDDCTFKIISLINLDNEPSINAFNELCINALNEKISENPNKLTTALLSFKNPVNIDAFQQLVNAYGWNVRSINLKYVSDDDIAYIHSAIFDNRLSENMFDSIGIDHNRISGVYGCEIEATVKSFLEYFAYYAYNTKILNLVSLFADDWLVQNGYSPRVYTHIGFLGA